jgi:hypothetical protein
MTKEQFISVVERLATYAIMYAVGRGWLPLNMQGETLMFVAGGASIAYGWIKNSRYGKILAAQNMDEVSAIVMNSRGSDIAESSKTNQKVVNGETGRKIMEVVEISRQNKND